MNKYINKIKISLLSLSIFSGIVFFYPIESFVKFGKISWYLLIIVMFIRPLNDILPKLKIFWFLMKFRRQLWILIWIFVYAHAIWFIKWMQFDSVTDFIVDSNTWNYKWVVFWWFMALIACTPLLFTANSIATKFLWRKWKTLHRLAYLMFVLVAIHIYIIRWDVSSIIVILLWFIIYWVAYYKNKKKFKVASSWPKWLCVVCGYIYDENIWDPDSWIAPWTKFEDIPDDWLCPVCGVTKANFVLLEWWVKENEWKIVSKEYLTEDVIELKIQFKEELEYICGQFINFNFKDEEWEFRRSYSIVSKRWNIFTFLIKLNPNSRSSNLLKYYKFWDLITCWNITWSFKLQNTNNPKIFIATWTGLAPIYNMIITTPEEVQKKLYFWVPKKKDLFYIDKLKKVKNLEINLYLSKEEVRGYNFWRVNLDEINLADNVEVYICGNPIMVSEKSEYFINKIWKESVFFEKF